MPPLKITFNQILSNDRGTELGAHTFMADCVYLGYINIGLSLENVAQENKKKIRGHAGLEEKKVTHIRSPTEYMFL